MINWLISLVIRWLESRRAQDLIVQSGRDQMKAEINTQAAKTEAAIAQAVAEAPKNRSEVERVMREGRF